MKMSKKYNHIHRYKKVNIGGFNKTYLVYKCYKPACTHYIPLHLAEGQISECNICGEPFLMTKAILHAHGNKEPARPRCQDCKKTKTNEIVIDVLDRYEP